MAHASAQSSHGAVDWGSCCGPRCVTHTRGGVRPRTKLTGVCTRGWASKRAKQARRAKEERKQAHVPSKRPRPRLALQLVERGVGAVQRHRSQLRLQLFPLCHDVRPHRLQSTNGDVNVSRLWNPQQATNAIFPVWVRVNTQRQHTSSTCKKPRTHLHTRTQYAHTHAYTLRTHAYRPRTQNTQATTAMTAVKSAQSLQALPYS